MVRYKRGTHLLFAAAVALVAGTTLLLVSDDASATHYVAGSLEWSKTEAPGMDVVEVTGYLTFDTAFFTPCQSMMVGSRVPGGTNAGTLTVDGVPQQYELEVVHTDPQDCTFTGRIRGVGHPTGVIVPVASSPARSMWVQWSNCCREDSPHVNNANKMATLRATVPIGVVDDGPVIDFPRTTDHPADSYGRVSCAADTVCTFQLIATDPDGPVAWRLATGSEAGSGFQQPGAPWTGEFTVSGGGEVQWTTTGATPGELYSTQLIAMSGSAQVPIDFMIRITAPPPASIRSLDGPAVVQTLEDATFTADVQPLSATVDWTFSDGSVATGRTVTRSFADSGNVTATAVVTDSAGNTASGSLNVRVLNRAPTAAMTAEARGTTVTFADDSTDLDGTIVAWHWDLGDGTRSNEPSFEHRYRPGTYVVTLTVTDDDGDKATTTRTITVPA